ATDPKVLLCDEATSALDPTTTASILELLKDLNRKLRVTMLVITHQMSVIEEVCSRVAILDEGEIVEQGTVEDIFSHPSTDAARRLVYPGGVGVLPDRSRTIRIAFNGGTAYQPLIASLALDCGVKANILGADTRNIDGKAFGTMLLGLPDDANEAAKAVSYLRAQPHVTVEEAVLPEGASLDALPLYPEGERGKLSDPRAASRSGDSGSSHGRNSHGGSSRGGSKAEKLDTDSSAGARNAAAEKEAAHV
ncbi:MAG: hypothetical protein IJT94_05625, partial [Oscillibacter sp.]|nr:hypothetical protein [Oscillibacter sp.]